MKQRQDPITGDSLTTGEWISWKIQHLMRRWAFLGLITLLTIVCWATNSAAVLTWWKLGASYLALVIESIVGMAMFNQCIRDAVVSRQTRANSQRIEKMAGAQVEVLDRVDRVETQNHALLERQNELLERIDALLEHAKTGVLPKEIVWHSDSTT